MELTELKLFLKIDGTDLDTNLAGYQLAAEKYLLNAGIVKDYDDALYKIVITIIVGTFIENPSLIVAGNVSANSLGMTVNSLITQLSLSQVVL